jgi:DNA-binding transcriptional regulator WhiA
MLTNRFAIPSGVKCYTVQIPVEIVNSEKKLINSTLRGMFDTDGGIGIDKRRSYKVPYIRINYSSVSEKLIRQIEKFLLDYNIKYSIHRKGNTLIVQINGKENVKRFISEIGFSNKRHLDKIRKFL